MAHFYSEPSHTFSEYLLIPGYTSTDCIPSNVSLVTPLVKFRRGERSEINLNIPLVSAVMQSVSDDRMAIALAREGGMSFIYGSQSIEDEAAMVARVKSYKAGFVVSDSNLTPDNTLADVLALVERNGHGTIAVTDNGAHNGHLLGIVTGRDYRVSRMSPELKVSEFMTPRARLITAPADTTLKEANDIIWDNKLNALPIVDDEDRLCYFVFRKDYSDHKENPQELLDSQKRFMVGAGINTRDYAERVPALIDAGVDVLCIDASEGYTCWQKQTLDFIRQKYGDSVKVGAGEGSNRARNWQRYDLGGKGGLNFEEGVDSYVVYAGPLHDNVAKSLYKVKSTMCNCGVTNIPDLQKNARITLVSSTSIVEGGYHDVILKTTNTKL